MSHYDIDIYCVYCTKYVCSYSRDVHYTKYEGNHFCKDCTALLKSGRIKEERINRNLKSDHDLIKQGIAQKAISFFQKKCTFHVKNGKSITTEGCTDSNEAMHRLANLDETNKHAKLIDLWINGAKIQVYDNFYTNEPQWIDDPIPSWNEDWEYRVKPSQLILDYADLSKDDLRKRMHALLDKMLDEEIGIEGLRDFLHPFDKS